PHPAELDDQRVAGVDCDGLADLRTQTAERVVLTAVGKAPGPTPRATPPGELEFVDPSRNGEVLGSIVEGEGLRPRGGDRHSGADRARGEREEGDSRRPAPPAARSSAAWRSGLGTRTTTTCGHGGSLLR